MRPEVANDRAERFRELDERLLDAQYLVYDDEDALRQTNADARRELEQLFAAELGEGAFGDVAKTQDEAAPGLSETISYRACSCSSYTAIRLRKMDRN